MVIVTVNNKTRESVMDTNGRVITEYVETQKRTDDGQVIYNGRTGRKGRPPEFTKQGDEMVAVRQ